MLQETLTEIKSIMAVVVDDDPVLKVRWPNLENDIKEFPKNNIEQTVEKLEEIKQCEHYIAIQEIFNGSLIKDPEAFLFQKILVGAKPQLPWHQVIRKNSSALRRKKIKPLFTWIDGLREVGIQMGLIDE